MDNKLIIILIIVGIFAILIGISFISDINEDKSKETNVQTTTTILARPLTCEENCKNDTTCINNCKLGEVNKITTKKNAAFKDCDVINDNLIKETCINNLALKLSSEKLDISYCDNIGDIIKRDNCKTNVIVDKALKNKDSSLCEEISNINVKEMCKNALK